MSSCLAGPVSLSPPPKRSPTNPKLYLKHRRPREWKFQIEDQRPRGTYEPCIRTAVVCTLAFVQVKMAR